MEYEFNLNMIFHDQITCMDKNYGASFSINSGFNSFSENLREDTNVRIYEDPRRNIEVVVNSLGLASTRSQKLSATITSWQKLKLSNHHLYLLKDEFAFNGKGSALGFIKVGKKPLFLLDEHGKQLELSPLCVLDFYVHESKQRSGFGKKIFEHMLKSEAVDVHHLAIDRPSEKFLYFLKKHYKLSAKITQVNNFVIFHGFFHGRRDKRISRGREIPITDRTPPEAMRQCSLSSQPFCPTSYDQIGVQSVHNARRLNPLLAKTSHVERTQPASSYVNRNADLQRIGELFDNARRGSGTVNSNYYLGNDRPSEQRFNLLTNTAQRPWGQLPNYVMSPGGQRRPLSEQTPSREEPNQRVPSNPFNTTVHSNALNNGLNQHYDDDISLSRDRFRKFKDSTSYDFDRSLSGHRLLAKDSSIGLENGRGSFGDAMNSSRLLHELRAPNQSEVLVASDVPKGDEVNLKASDSTMTNHDVSANSMFQLLHSDSGVFHPLLKKPPVHYGNQDNSKSKIPPRGKREFVNENSVVNSHPLRRHQSLHSGERIGIDLPGVMRNDYQPFGDRLSRGNRASSADSRARNAATNQLRYASSSHGNTPGNFVVGPPKQQTTPSSWNIFGVDLDSTDSRRIRRVVAPW